jgi:transcriptional regulator with XRE-family HTH domain
MTKPWKALSEIRDLQGVTKAEIAKKLGVHPSSVGRIEAGVPALSGEYVAKICAMLSVNEDFMSGKTDYPFLPKSYLILKVRGLNNRLRPLGWLELLISFSKRLEILLLLRRNKDTVVAACVKDDRDSVFLISIEIPLLFKTIFEYTRKQPEGKIQITAEEYFDSPNTVSFHGSFSDIAHYPKDLVESMIEDALAGLLSDKEKELIKVVRKKDVPIEKMIEYAKKLRK